VDAGDFLDDVMGIEISAGGSPGRDGRPSDCRRRSTALVTTVDAGHPLTTRALRIEISD